MKKITLEILQKIAYDIEGEGVDYLFLHLPLSDELKGTDLLKKILILQEDRKELIDALKKEFLKFGIEVDDGDFRVPPSITVKVKNVPKGRTTIVRPKAPVRKSLARKAKAIPGRK